MIPNQNSSAREASHAGSWYSDNPSVLRNQLNGWLSEAKTETNIPVRGIISPHAGYSFSGPTAGYVFKHLKANRDNIDRVFILGPSHHHYTPGCELSGTSVYETPLGDLTLDLQVMKSLESTGAFERMSLKVDEDEHSIEMQLPYIALAMEGKPFTVVPVLVGALDKKGEQQYGQLLAPYLEDPKNFFVISSDFCHWGKRFQYTYYDKKEGEIWQSIQHLDQMGMKTIESMDPAKFFSYQQRYKNTICGRHAIAIMMNAAVSCKPDFECRFIYYDQSSKCKYQKDSSVSYAAAVFTPCQK